MSGHDNVDNFIHYEPNFMPEAKKRRKYRQPPPELPTLPGVPANASQYTLSPQNLLLSPLPIDGPLSSDILLSPEDAYYTPSQSLLLLSPLRRLTSDAIDTPHPKPVRLHLSRTEHVTAVLDIITEHFRSFGDFLDAFAEDFPRDKPDPRSLTHIRTLSSWLSGATDFSPAAFIQVIYSNRYSVPKSDSTYSNELDLAFDGAQDLPDIHWARVALSIWATQLVGKRCSLEVKRLGKDDPDFPDFKTHLQASVKPRMKSKRQTVTQDDLFSFSMARTADILKRRARTTWYITECMAATRQFGMRLATMRRSVSRPSTLFQETF